MKRLFKNASGPQTLLNIGLIAQLVVLSAHTEYDFIFFGNMDQLDMQYLFISGFIGMFLIQTISVNKCRKKYQNDFINQSRALSVYTKRFNLVSMVNGFFCFTFSTSIIYQYEIAREFTFSWAVFTIFTATSSWYLLLFLSVYICRISHHYPETPLDMVIEDEKGDF